MSLLKQAMEQARDVETGAEAVIHGRSSATDDGFMFGDLSPAMLERAFDTALDRFSVIVDKAAALTVESVPTLSAISVGLDRIEQKNVENQAILDRLAADLKPVD